uniref:Ribosomal RNA methyltransferase FtsJ domain-containing protein n=1 Tax=viral metagenome TaxID=1070528 RepID=A0A6C0DV71_9ZZZZ
MTYYLLPRTNPSIIKFINCESTDNIPGATISNSLSSFLYDIKGKLNNYPDLWDVFKKYTNPYEYIHSVPPYRKKNISKYKPLSRSYFKMIEMINLFDIKYVTKPAINAFHLAEGPGGFIEAILNIRQCPQDKYIGMTILDDISDPNIPGWKKSNMFLKRNANVSIEAGADNTGNILSIANFKYCNEKYASSMDLITADGGFDFSFDFNNQEISIAQLLFGQVCYALIMQKQEGNFILKIFDCFMQHTIDIIYLLSAFYERVYIIKPNTSRYANSEKYIVCKGFIYSKNDSFYPLLLETFTKMIQLPQDKYIRRFLSIPIPYYFSIKLEELNSVFGQKQIENIHFTISFLEQRNKQDKIENLIKVNIQKCIQWCNRNNVEYNNMNNISQKSIDDDSHISEPEN